MKLRVDKVSVVRFLNGEMSLHERRELETWISESESNRKYFNDIKTIYEASHKELNNIADTDNEWKRLLNRIDSDKKKKISLLSIYSRVAAVLLLPLLGLGLFYHYNGNVKNDIYSNDQLVVVTPLGQKSRLILPDSTVVWLNSASELSYSSFGADGLRKVCLKGEGYFEVTKDAEHPFIVSTKDYDVKVLGTKFNVRSYDTDDVTETALKEGKVAISFSNGSSYELKPGQVAMAGNNGRIKIKNTNTENLICWKNNILRFNNTPVKDMTPMLEHWYGVKIDVKNMDKVADKRFTMTIKTESLKETLQLMKFVTPIKYSVKGDKVEIVFLDI